MIDLNPAIATALLQSLAGYLDAGNGTATMRFYTAPKPSPGAAITSQVLLGSVDLHKPFAASVNGASLQPDAIPNMVLVASGTVVWARFIGGNNAWVWDCPVGDEQSSAFIRIEGGLAVLEGGIIVITAGVLTLV